MSEWFEEGTGVVSMPAAEIKIGMRLAEYKFGEQRTVLTPVWDTGYNREPRSGPWARTSDGKYHGWHSIGPGHATFPWVHPEIRDEFMPPHTGEWITNVRESGEVKGWADRARAVRTWEVDARRYSLLFDPDRVFWVLREENGERWHSPIRTQFHLAEAQFEAIASGKGW